MFGSFPPSLWLVCASKVYSGLGADIVYGIITLIERTACAISSWPHGMMESQFTAWGTGSHYYREHWCCGGFASPARLYCAPRESLLRLQRVVRGGLPWYVPREQNAQVQRGS